MEKLPDILPSQQIERAPITMQIRQKRREVVRNRTYSQPAVRELFHLVDYLAVEVEVTRHQRDLAQESLTQIRKERAPKKQLLVPRLPEINKGGFLSPSKI
jgi:hypothetical protein